MPSASATRSRVRQPSPNLSMSSSIDELQLPMNEVYSSPLRADASREPSAIKSQSPTKQTRVFEIGGSPHNASGAGRMGVSAGLSPERNGGEANIEGPGGSPWRIRVTVEADDAEEQATQAIQAAKVRSQSRTFTVPLKDAAEDPVDGGPSPKKPRAPRKGVDRDAIGGPAASEASAAKRKPKTTPAKRRNTRRQSGLVEDIASRFDGQAIAQPADPNSTPSTQSVKRGRGRPRRSDLSATAATSQNGLIQTDGAASGADDDDATSTAVLPSRVPDQSRVKASQQRPARAQADFAALTPLHRKPKDPRLPVPELAKTPPFMKSLEGRVPTPRKPPGWIDDEQEDAEQEEQDADAMNEMASDFEDGAVNFHETIEGDPGHQADENNIEEHVSFDDEEAEPPINQQGTDDSTVALDRSLEESEGFTMVSIQSLKSHQAQAQEPLQSANVKDRLQSSSNLQSKHPSTARVTPHISKTDAQTEPPRTAPRPFDAYGSGTRRELRKGFRAGVELARDTLPTSGNRLDHATAPMSGQSGLSQSARTGEARLPTPADSIRDESSSSNPSYEEMSWRPTSLNRRHDAARYQEQPGRPEEGRSRHEASNAGYDEMSWQPTAPTPLRNIHSQRENDTDHRNDSHGMAHDDSSPPMPPLISIQESAIVQSPAKSDIWYEEADRSLEDSMNPQRERRRRPRQAPARHDNGSADQIPAHPQEQDGVAEAAAPPTPQKRSIVAFDNAAPSPIPSLSDLLPEDNIPTRSKIPRTWRRESASDFLYSDETESPQQQRPTKPSSRSTAAAVGSLVPSVLARWTKSTPNGKARGGQPNDSGVAPATDGEETPPPGHLQQLRKGILSSPARRASSPAKEVHWVPDEALEEMNDAENLNDEYFSSSEESESSEMGPDELVEIDPDANEASQNLDEDEDEDGDENEEMDSNEENVPPDENYTSPASDHREPPQSITPQGRILKRPISALCEVRHDAAGNSSLLQPKQKQRRLFDNTTDSLPHHRAANASSRRAGTAAIWREPPTTSQPTTSFLSRLSGWLFAPSITTPIDRTPFPAHLRSDTQAIPPPSPPLQKPPYTWTLNHSSLLKHYHAHSQRLLHLSSPSSPSNPAPPVPKGPPLNSRYHDALASLPSDLVALINTQTTVRAHCPLHYPTPAPSYGTALLTSLGIYGSPNPYANRDEMRCTAPPARSSSRTSLPPGKRIKHQCPGLPAPLEGKKYTHLYTLANMRTVHAFLAEVKDRGIPLIAGGVQRDEDGKVKRLRQDWGHGRAEREWVLGQVVAVVVGVRVQKDIERLEQRSVGFRG